MLARLAMNMIKTAFAYAGINIKKEYWDTYDDMNEVIIGLINGKQ